MDFSSFNFPFQLYSLYLQPNGITYSFLHIYIKKFFSIFAQAFSSVYLFFLLLQIHTLAILRLHANVTSSTYPPGPIIRYCPPEVSLYIVPSSCHLSLSILCYHCLVHGRSISNIALCLSKLLPT